MIRQLTLTFVAQSEGFCVRQLTFFVSIFLQPHALAATHFGQLRQRKNQYFAVQTNTSKMVAADLAEEAIKYGMEACIECGLCSFACPSKIPLLDNIMKGKKELEERGRWSHPIGLQKLEVEGKL